MGIHLPSTIGRHMDEEVDNILQKVEQRMHGERWMPMLVGDWNQCLRGDELVDTALQPTDESFRPNDGEEMVTRAMRRIGIKVINTFDHWWIDACEEEDMTMPKESMENLPGRQPHARHTWEDAEE